MAFQFIEKNKNGNLNLRDRKLPIILGIILGFGAFFYFFRVEISTNIGIELRKSYPKESFNVLNYAAVEGGITAQHLIVENGNSYPNNPEILTVYRRWLLELANKSEPSATALFNLGNYYIDGSYGFTKDQDKGAQMIVKSIHINPDMPNKNRELLRVAKIFLSNPNSNYDLLNSTDKNRILEARKFAQESFEAQTYGSAYVLAKTYLNLGKSSPEYVSNLLEVTKILMVGISFGEHDNGLLGNVYVDLFNVTGNKTYLFSAINYFKKASLDKDDPYFSIAQNQVESITKAYSG